MGDTDLGKRRSTQRVAPTNPYYNPRASHIRGASMLCLHQNTNQTRPNVIHIHPLCSKGKIRRFLYDIVEGKFFHMAMLLVILSNTAFIGLQTVPSVNHSIGWYLSLLDTFYLAVYIVEFVMKFVALGWKYFNDRWNLFDFFIVIMSFFDFIWPIIMNDNLSIDTDLFKIFRLLKSFRALRALRVIRTIQFLKNLQITVSAIIQSIPALGSIIMLISLVLYIFAIIGKGLYMEVDPMRFGNIGKLPFLFFISRKYNLSVLEITLFLHYHVKFLN